MSKFEIWINGKLSDEYSVYENAKAHADMAVQLGNVFVLIKQDDRIIYQPATVIIT